MIQTLQRNRSTLTPLYPRHYFARKGHRSFLPKKEDYLMGDDFNGERESLAHPYHHLSETETPDILMHHDEPIMDLSEEPMYPIGHPIEQTQYSAPPHHHALCEDDEYYESP